MGNLHFRNQCCITDSNFKGDVEDIENNKEIEKEPFKVIEKTIDRAQSFISDMSPARRSSKDSN